LVRVLQTFSTAHAALGAKRTTLGATMANLRRADGAGAASPTVVGTAKGATTMSLRGLGVDRSALAGADLEQSATPGPASAERLHRASARDGYDTKPARANDKGATAEARHDRAQASEQRSDPFLHLARPVPQPARALARECVGLDKPLDLDATQLDRLASLQAKLGEGGVAMFTRMTKGSMLALADALAASSAESAATNRDLDARGEAAACLCAGKEKDTLAAFETCVRVAARGKVIVEQDINALVQQVLRESYLIGSEQLLDYAEKVKFYNHLKKKARAQLKDARATKAEWQPRQAAMGEGKTFVSERPFAMKELDEGTGEWYVPTTSEKDVEEEIRNVAANATSSLPSPALDYETFIGPSTLSSQDRVFLETAWREHDAICDNIARMVEIVPKLTRDELKHYLPRFLDALHGGAWKNTHEPEMIKIYNALTPIQCVAALNERLHPLVRGYSRDGGLLGPLGLNKSEVLQIDLHLNDGCVQVADELHLPFGTDPKKIQAALEASLKRVPPSAGPQAPSTGSMTSANPSIGSPRVARTTEQLDVYIKGLEDKMNGIGDDAQLANVDLQNELQKQQQLLQMMSNISKMLHETALAVVRKMGG